MSKTAAAQPTQFDAAYYQHFYADPKIVASGLADKRKRAAFVASSLNLLNVPVRSVCDIGCGLGQWRTALKKHYPVLAYTGVEVSDYLCRTYGWVQASAHQYKPRRKVDLVIAQSSLHYLDKAECARAIATIASYCRFALYLEVATMDDFASGVLDLARTDQNIYRHKASWYRRQLAPYFVAIGNGLFLHKEAAIPLLALEAIAP
jgi:SAM-dependent methyltransferase